MTLIFGTQSGVSDMAYIVAITEQYHTDYIAEGKTYVENGSVYVPLTSRIQEAKRYKTFALAQRASLRRGENMYGTIEIKEVGGE